MKHPPANEVRMKHAGEEVLILGNGPSLKRNDLSKVPPSVTLFGTNRSWTEARAHYHTISDRVHMRELHEGKWRPDFLFCGMPDWPPDVHGVRFQTMPYRQWKGRLSPVFSEDLERGVSMGGTPFVALQFCKWMGFSTIWLAGIDLQPDPETGEGHHYPGHKIARGMFEEQSWNFGIAKEALTDTRVINLNPSSLLELWPKKKFEEVFP